jgi:predicted nucleotidyltransferase
VDAQPHVIYETVHGSTAYGLARAGSDVDLKGIVIGPARWYFGPFTAPEQIELGPDHVRYELRKFVRLAADANPTVLELLWTDPEHHREVTPAGARLLAQRDLFLSRSIADRFGRYALAQMRRIRTHRSWLLDPPSGPPTREQFGLPERSALSGQQLAAVNELGASAVVASEVVEYVARERRYESARTHWQQYTKWLQARNPKRAELEARHGYDTKHALHLVRLQRMALEILTTGEVRVRRDDRDELLAIRDGAWSYEQLESTADVVAEQIDAATATSPLPERPDEAAIEELCVSLIEEHLSS